ncbi:MAG: putative toxin-antitoxin system toxin component, PIN family [bacterium]|nr:putative toxin-antitoxin system toxin component, PIN family [bacterium]
MKTKVVFDTNILVSAIVFGGNPRRCLELALEEKIQLYTSRTLLAELVEKLQKKFNWSEESIKKTIWRISQHTVIVYQTEKVDKIKNDPSDNHILEVAEAAKADFIITGDKKHILPLKKHKTAKILPPADFLKELQKRKPVV